MALNTTWESDSDTSSTTAAKISEPVKKVGNFAPDPEDSLGEKIGKFVMRNIIVIITAILALATLAWSTSTANSRSDTLKAQEAQILQLQQSLDSSQTTSDEEYVETIKIISNGMDINRKRKDDGLVNGLFKTAFTWNGLNEYLAQRNDVKNRYGIDKDSQFLTEFLPGEDQGVVRKDEDGATHKIVDDGVNSSYDGMRSYVTSVDGTIYNYIAFVKSTARSKDGTGSSTMNYVVRYTINNDKLVNISGDVIPVPVQRAG